MSLQGADRNGGVLDVEDLFARCLGNADFVWRVLDKFQERCEEDLAAMERACLEGDVDALARLAHRLKGASANASALRLREHAAEIEHAARRQALAAIPPRLEDLKRESSRFAAAVSRLDASGCFSEEGVAVS